MSLPLRVLKSGVSWGMAGLVIRLAGALAIMALSTKFIAPEELGFWYLFTSFLAMTSVLDLGVTRTAAYRLADLLSRAEREGASVIRHETSVFVACLRSIYKKLFILTFLGLSFVGGWWIWIHSPEGPHSTTVRLAWLMACPSFALVVISNYSRVVLYATDRLNVFQFLSTCAFSLQAVIGIGGILAGFAIYSLVGANLVMFAVLATGALYVKYRPGKMAAITVATPGDNSTTKALLQKSIGTFCNTLTSYVVVNANVLIASHYLPLSGVASYGLTIQVAIICSQLSTIWIDVKQPLFAHWAQTEPETLRDVFVSRMRLALLTYCATIAAALTIGPCLLSLIGAQTTFLGPVSFVELALFLLMFMHYSQFESLSLCLGENPFIPAYLISAAAGILLTVGLAPTMGIAGVILGPFLAQLAWNTWWVPLVGLRKLKLSPIEYLRRLATPKWQSEPSRS